MDTEQLPSIIRARIKSGELPSTVLRSVLDQYNILDKAEFRHLLVEAFVDSVLIHFVWKWRVSDATNLNDTQFNLRVIGHLIEAGVTLPWDREYCESEWRRIKPALDEETQKNQSTFLEAVSLNNLTAMLSNQPGRVVCVQALWDGDTSGWFISLSAFAEENSILKEIFLGKICFGTDIRIFSGNVPPWPEAQYAQEVGKKLAQEYRAEFYFPSPNEPDDNHPVWTERKHTTSANSTKKAWWKLW